MVCGFLEASWRPHAVALTHSALCTTSMGECRRARVQLLKAFSLGAPRPPSSVDQLYGWER